MKKTHVIQLLALGLIPCLLTGCAGKKTALNPDKPMTITVWDYYTGAQLEAFHDLVTEFNNTRGKELGIIVSDSSEGGVSDLETNVFAAANKEVGARAIPNIFASYTDTAYKLNEMGLLADLSGYLTDEEKEEYVESYIEEGAFDKSGEMMIFPVAKATEIFFLNRTDWDKFSEATGTDISLLSTIEGLVEAAKIYYEWTDSQTTTPEDGKALFGRDSIANYMFAGSSQLGTTFFTKDDSGKVIFDFPEDTVRMLWDYYYVPYINGYFTSAGRFRSDDVKTGTILCFVGSSAGATFFPEEVILEDDESYPIETTVFEAPQFAESERCAIQQGAGMAVTNGSEAEIEASVEFLKWFTDTGQNVRFSVVSGYLPVKKEANDIDEIKKAGGMTERVEAVMETAVATMNENKLTYALAFANGTDARDILENSMENKAKADREAVEKKIEAGATRREAVAEYDTDENFLTWYEDVLAQLKALVLS
jgi:multiple sugar transport system substrate-binding protein